jgi:hypothetical protein
MVPSGDARAQGRGPSGHGHGEDPAPDAGSQDLTPLQPRALEIADRAYVLEEGRVVADGPPAILRQQTRIREAYLGLREERDTS